MSQSLTLDASPLKDYLKSVRLLLENVPEGVRDSFLGLIENILLECPIGRLFTTAVTDDGCVVLGVGSGLEAIAAAMRAFESDFSHA